MEKLPNVPKIIEAVTEFEILVSNELEAGRIDRETADDALASFQIYMYGNRTI